MGLLFLSIRLHRQPIKLLTGRVLEIPPLSQIWDGFMDIWTPRHPCVGNNNNKITLNRTNPITSKMWDGYLELCEHSVILKESDWSGTDRSHCPGVYWAALNGAQWLCGMDLRPWFPPGWLDHCTLAFPGHEGEFIPLSLFSVLAKMLWCIQRLYQIYPTSFNDSQQRVLCVLTQWICYHVIFTKSYEKTNRCPKQSLYISHFISVQLHL